MFIFYSLNWQQSKTSINCHPEDQDGLQTKQMDNFNAGLGAHKSNNLYLDIIYIFNVRLYYNIVICIKMIMNLMVLENLKTNFYDYR